MLFTIKINTHLNVFIVINDTATYLGSSQTWIASWPEVGVHDKRDEEFSFISGLERSLHIIFIVLSCVYHP